MIFRLIFYLISITFILQASNKIGVYEKLNSTLPLNLTFTNQNNQTKTLKEFINNKPTILTFNYFECPSLCNPQLYGVTKVLNQLDLIPYVDYNVLTISISTDDTYKSAKDKKELLLKTIKKSFPPQTWNFLTSTQKNIDEITDAVGFKYEKRIKEGVVDYLHPGVIIVISAKGKISRYLNGIDFLPFDLKLAILEAKKEKFGPTIAKTLLYCFAYDAKAKTYVFQAEKIVGTIIFLIILIFFIYLIKTGRRKK